MSDVCETLEYKNHIIKVCLDTEPQNPRTEWDNLGTMICFHKRYDLGDKHSLSITEAIKLEKSNDVISLPIYMYDHSGITINTTGFSCPWDSGVIGFIYITKEKVRKEYSWKVLTKNRIEKIKEYLKNEVETYNSFLTGNVFGYEITKNDTDIDESCWGFYDQKDCMSEAKSMVDFLDKQENENNGVQIELNLEKNN